MKLVRSVVVGLATLGLLVVPVVGSAQQPKAPWRIAYFVLPQTDRGDPYVGAIRAGLQELGYVEGKHFVFEIVSAGGRQASLPRLAAEIVRKADAIVAVSDQVIAVMKEATRTIPIVMVACDALEARLVSSLSRPGGNITGVTCISAELSAKRIEILREIVPGLARATVLYNPKDPGKVNEARGTATAARAAGLKVQMVEVAGEEDLDLLARAAREAGDGLVVLGDGVTFHHLPRIVRLAATARVPTIYGYRAFVDAGGLISYGPSLEQMFRITARHLTRIMQGANAGDLPVEQPTKFELITNLKTARALGITIPPSLLLRADGVVE